MRCTQHNSRLYHELPTEERLTLLEAKVFDDHSPQIRRQNWFFMVLASIPVALVIGWGYKQISMWIGG